jgi:hypothetical protein
MKDWIEDALGAVCLFGIGYGAFFIAYGMGF